MPLTFQQAADLETAINAYGFPPVYFDFLANNQVHAPSMTVVETAIRTMLLSPVPQEVKHGLANVVYWGNAQAPYQAFRVTRFMESVTNQQIYQFQALVAGGQIPTLRQIKQQKIREFSGISFISKVIAFLDPSNFCVLDLQLAKLGNGTGVKALHGLTYTTQIGVTDQNIAFYAAWCQECLVLNTRYYAGRYRAVDIERGFFHLIQTNRLDYAREIYDGA